MDGAAMHMPLTPMRMIRIGMDMDEWNDEHPEGRPEQDQQTGARGFNTYLFHEYRNPSTVRLPQQSAPSFLFTNRESQAGDILSKNYVAHEDAITRIV